MHEMHEKISGVFVHRERSRCMCGYYCTWYKYLCVCEKRCRLLWDEGEGCCCAGLVFPQCVCLAAALDRRLPVAPFR